MIDLAWPSVAVIIIGITVIISSCVKHGREIHIEEVSVASKNGLHQKLIKNENNPIHDRIIWVKDDKDSK